MSPLPLNKIFSEVRVTVHEDYCYLKYRDNPTICLTIPQYTLMMELIDSLDGQAAVDAYQYIRSITDGNLDHFRSQLEGAGV